MSAEKKWDGHDRRAQRSPLGTDVVTNNDLDEALAIHAVEEQKALKLMIDELSIRAFPDGPDSHRLAHKAMIDAANAEHEFWSGLKADVAKKSIWGILQVLTFLAIAGLAAKLGLGSIIGGVK